MNDDTATDKPESVTVVMTDGRKLLLNVSQPMPADLVAFEDEFDVSSDVLNGAHGRVKWSLYIVWRIARRVYPDVMATSFLEFVDQVEDMVENEAEVPSNSVDPTEAAPPIG